MRRADSDGLVRRRHPELPWGTLAVNVLGCFLLGAATSAFPSTGLGALWMVTTGFSGGFITFSMAMPDATEFARAGRRLVSARLVLGIAGSNLLVFLGGTVLAPIF